MRWQYWCFLWSMLGLLSVTGLGCRHTISAPIRQEAAPPIPFNQLRANPEAFMGRTVILGGDILETRNTEEQTFLEVLQKPLDRLETPKRTDQTAGRFMARCQGYLDPAVYAKDRQVTIAGRVLGRHTGQVGEAEYVYPLISCLEFHLWSRSTSFYDTRDPWYYPWYWHPFYGHPLFPHHYLYHRHRSRHRRR